MTAPKDNAVATTAQNVSVAKIDIPQGLELLKESVDELFGGEGGIVQFPRAKVASGGAEFFEVPDEYGETTMERTISGTLIYAHPANAYWPERGTTNEPPQCFSMDGKTGYDSETNSHRVCASCPYYQFGSGFDKQGNPSKGKACKTGYRLYILREGEVWPLVVSVPPTSRMGVSKRISQLFVQRFKPYYSSPITLSLEPAKAASGDKYVKIIMSLKRTPEGKPILYDIESQAALAKYQEQIKAAAVRQKVEYLDEPDTGAGISPDYGKPTYQKTDVEEMNLEE